MSGVERIHPTADGGVVQWVGVPDDAEHWNNIKENMPSSDNNEYIFTSAVNKRELTLLRRPDLDRIDGNGIHTITVPFRYMGLQTQSIPSLEFRIRDDTILLGISDNVNIESGGFFRNGQVVFTISPQLGDIVIPKVRTKNIAGAPSDPPPDPYDPPG